MNKTAATIYIILGFTMHGCAVVHTQKLKPEHAAAEGIVYYLPIRPIKFEFVRALSPTKPDISKAVANVKAANDADMAAEDARAAAERLFKRTIPKTTGRLKAETELQTMTAAKLVTKDSLEAAKKKLKEEVEKSATADDGTPQLTDTITITALPSVADTAHRYAAKLNHLVTRTDKLDLKTNAAGLISNVTAKAEDKTADILVTLAQSIAARGTGGAQARVPMNFEPLGSVPKGEISCEGRFKRLKDYALRPFKFELIFDPTLNKYIEKTPRRSNGSTETSLSPWEYISASLCAKGADYVFDWQPLGVPMVLAAQGKGDAPDQGDANDNKSDGIFYRRLLPYRLNIYTGIRNDNGEVESLISTKALAFDLPNGSHPELLKLKAGFFVTTDFLTEFQDGVLVSHKEERPSEALAIVKIPYDIVKALISIPAEILSLKVNYSTKEAALIDARTAVLKSQKALDDAEKANEKQD